VRFDFAYGYPVDFAAALQAATGKSDRDLSASRTQFSPEFINRVKATSSFYGRSLTMLSSIRSPLNSAHITTEITSLAIPFWWNVVLHCSARGTPMCGGLALDSS
jgi:hypothetical protein